MEEMKPTVGRIVHFNEMGVIRPAIVIGVNPEDPTEVSLNVFTKTGVEVRLGVAQGAEVDQWDWMPFQKDQLKRPGYSEAAESQGQDVSEEMDVQDEAVPEGEEATPEEVGADEEVSIPVRDETESEDESKKNE